MSGDRSVPCPARPSQVSPWFAPMAYKLGGRGILPIFFNRIDVVGAENLPRRGPVLLAPTHRSRWDSLLVAHVAKEATGRYLRFMVTADECLGIQGWLIKKLGGFPVNVRRPAIATLRHGVKLLQQQQMLVIFPEGDIFRDNQVHRLKPGLARIALKAQQGIKNHDVNIVPISLQYDRPCPVWGSRVKIQIGTPLQVSQYRSIGGPKTQAKQLTADLGTALETLSGKASGKVSEKAPEKPITLV
ncbi:MAG: 1-acyl-sn-glycerol-3-phosphate acyltransferase [Cyanobacteria bacterium P01_A01_bin.114]